MCRVHSLHVSSSSSPPTPHRPPLMQTKPDPLETQRNSRPPDPSVVRRALTDCSQRKNTKHSDESNRPQPCHHPRLPTYFRRIPQAATPSPPSRDTGLWPGHRRPGIRLPRRSWITSAASTESSCLRFPLGDSSPHPRPVDGWTTSGSTARERRQTVRRTCTRRPTIHATPEPSRQNANNQSHHDPRRRLQRHPTQDDAPRVTPDSPSEPVDQSSWPLRPRPPTSSDTSNTSHRCLPSRSRVPAPPVADATTSPQTAFAARPTSGPPTSTYLTTTSAFTPMCRVHSLHVSSSSSPPTPHRPPLMQTKPDPLETQRNSRPPDPSVVRRALTDCSQRKNTKHSDESNRPQPCHHPRLPTYFRRIPQAATPSPPSRDTGLWPGHRRPGIRLPRRSWITSAASTESSCLRFHSETQVRTAP
ncbi:hypothetical protein TGGT1_280070A, partial [Toxoplasma gondii GT1]